jgi:hypothetical protein
MHHRDYRPTATRGLLLVVAALAIAFTGCGGSDEASTEPIKVDKRAEMVTEGNKLCSEALKGQGPVTAVDSSNDQLKALAEKAGGAATQLKRLDAPQDVDRRLAPTLTSLSRVARAARAIIPIDRSAKPGTTRAAQENLVLALSQLRISTKISRLPDCEIKQVRI